MRSLAILLLAAGAACRAKALAPPPEAVATAQPTAAPVATPSEPTGETAQERERRLEREEYAAALEAATLAGQTCKQDPTAIDVDALLRTYEILAPYEQSPARDAAIQTLEDCRKLAVARVEAALPDPGGAQAADASATVRRAVEEKRKRTTKPLRIVVRGKHVTVEEQTKPKRAPHHPKTLKGHCAMSDAPAIDDGGGIALAEAGEGGCSSAFRFSKQADYVVDRVGLTEPFVVKSTEKRKTPMPTE
jgi:hypothetical protein